MKRRKKNLTSMFGLVWVKRLGSSENGQNGIIHNWCNGGCWFAQGWNEPAPTNAPIEDEVIEAIMGMNQKHILLCLEFLVFLTFSLHQKISLLPTSFPPTSPLLLTSPYFVLTPLLELRNN